MSETAFVALCLETLAMGAVQSYVDIMYLAAEGSLTMKQLGEVRQELVAAEQGRRHGDAGKVSAALVALSGRFRALGKMKIAVFFLERLLEVARVTADVPSEMRAHNELGEAHESLGSDDTTLLHHNAHRALATSSGDETEKALACSNLVRVYSKQARREEEAGNHERALQLFLSALEAGESTGDVVAEADTCYGAGRSYLMNGQAAAAVPLLQQYLRAVLSADELADRELEAYAALGAAQLAAANLEGASECLDEITHAGDVDSRLLAEAHEALGIIHAQKGRMAEAVRFLDAAFQNRQELQSTEFADRKRLDKLRLLLGFVRSESLIGGYLEAAVGSNMAGLLEWKRARGGPLAAASGAGP